MQTLNLFFIQSVILFINFLLVICWEKNSIKRCYFVFYRILSIHLNVCKDTHSNDILFRYTVCTLCLFVWKHDTYAARFFRNSYLYTLGSVSRCAMLETRTCFERICTNALFRAILSLAWISSSEKPGRAGRAPRSSRCVVSKWTSSPKTIVCPRTRETRANAQLNRRRFSPKPYSSQQISMRTSQPEIIQNVKTCATITVAITRNYVTALFHNACSNFLFIFFSRITVN